MKNIYAVRNEVRKKHDTKLQVMRIDRRLRHLVMIVAILSFLSLLGVYSASFYIKGNMGSREFLKHTISFGASLFAFVITLKIDYRNYEKKNYLRAVFLIPIIVLAAMPILGAVFPKLIPLRNGARGWITAGPLSIQPAEVFKIFYVILMAYNLSVAEKERYEAKGIVASSGIIFGLFAFLIMFQNDLGTVIHYFSITLFMLFMSKISDKIIWRAVGAVSVLLTGVTIYVYLKFDTFVSGYKTGRIKSYVEGLLSNTYDQDKGYQVGQSLLGLGNGGIFGTGYGNGVQKYSYLPEIHTDFILASFGEEFGLIGILIVIVLFFGLFNRIKGTAVECEDYLGKYLSVGIAGYIFIQFLINISVAIGLLPVFGIPMPIMSFGGSSLLTVFMALGIVGNVNLVKRREARKKIKKMEIEKA
ncbi:MAG: FtsW/RodA/SpoVE family cell cycle protein [Fusobacteriaceae bacterium]